MTFMDGQTTPWWESGPIHMAPELEAPPGWGSMETFLYSQLSEYNPEIIDDPYAEYWFDKALFHNNELNPEDIAELQQDLKTYLWDEYGIEFDYQFNWDLYREWYDETN